MWCIILGQCCDMDLCNCMFFSALGNSTVSSSPPVAGERKSFSNVTRLGFAAAHDSPSLQIQETSGLHNNNTTIDSSAPTGIICLCKFIYSAWKKFRVLYNGTTIK